MRLGHRFMPILVASTCLSACRMYAPYEDCDNLGYATGDSFLVTIGEVVSADQTAPDLSCPVPQLGESFGVTVAQRVDENNGCYLPASGEGIPVFLQELVGRCGPGVGNLAFSCSSPEGSLYAGLGGARTGESTEGKFSYGWPAPELTCRVTMNVRIESSQ